MPKPSAENIKDFSLHTTPQTVHGFSLHFRNTNFLWNSLTKPVGEYFHISNVKTVGE